MNTTSLICRRKQAPRRGSPGWTGLGQGLLVACIAVGLWGLMGGWAGTMSTVVLQMHEDMSMGGGMERRGQSPEPEVRPAV